MSNSIFVCTDLDRTLLPNGQQPESPGARERFAALAARPEVKTAYVSGRHRALILEAIASYSLPIPDYVIADVGTSIFSVAHDEWTIWTSWQEEIGHSWKGLGHDQLATLFADLTSLRPQEAAKQNTFKLSYYTPPDLVVAELTNEMQSRLLAAGLGANLIWSLDETSGTGLLDVLPANATKLHAVKFVMQRQGYHLNNTLFAGDSGNDLEVLCSPVHSVLVKNATQEVRDQAVRLASANGTTDALYLAQGGFLGLNGNYSAGILEGLNHYLPATADWWN